jgi:Protein of unknown function (DUF3099)
VPKLLAEVPFLKLGIRTGASVVQCRRSSAYGGRVRERRATEPIHDITDARRGLREDVSHREIRYVISMGIRTVCFILAIVTHGWLRAIFIVAALVLPYLSVVYANTGRERRRAERPGYTPDKTPAIDPVRPEISPGVTQDTGRAG